MAGYIGSKASVVTPGAERKKVFSITTTTTSLTGLVYTPNFVHVYHNGVRLVDGTDYTATNGTSITLTTAAQNGDEVVVISFATFQTSDTVSASAGGTFSNAVTIDANGATVLTVDRATSDGTIIDLQKDGSSVGGISTSNGDMIVGTGVSRLNFYDATPAILPSSSETFGLSDGAIDFGNDGRRFRNLYLSGGVYLGGTGAANYLNDYEEGTWTPTTIGTITDPTVTYDGSTAGRYTKVGNHVNFWFYIKLTSVSGGSGNLNIGGLPFTNVNQGPVSEGHTTNINYYLNTNLASGRVPTGYARLNDNKIYITVSGAGDDTVVYPVTSMSNGFVLYGSGTLSVA